MIRPFCITIPVLLLSSRFPLCAIHTKRGNYTPPPLYIFTNVHLAQRILSTSFHLIFFILPLISGNVNRFFFFCNSLQNSTSKNVLFLQIRINFPDKKRSCLHKISFLSKKAASNALTAFFLFFCCVLMQPIGQCHQAIPQMHIFHPYPGTIDF